MSVACDLLDEDGGSPIYCSTLQQQRRKIEEPENTPSARILSEMIENKEEFSEFSMRLSIQHKEWFSKRPLDTETRSKYEDIARRSIQQQHEVEKSDSLPFEQFLQNYFEQT